MALLVDDRALLEAFRRGEPSALTQVYRFYSRRVVDYLGRFGGRAGADGAWSLVAPLDLEAAHQETFVRAFAPARRLAYDGLRPFEGYLLSIARSAAIDLLRRSGKIAREATSLKEAPDLERAPSDAPSPEEQALTAELRGVVGLYLAGLPESDRAFAQARFVDRLSQEDAAAVLDLTRAQVRTRERKLKESFVEHLVSAGWLEAAESAAMKREVALLLVALATLAASRSDPTAAWAAYGEGGERQCCPGGGVRWVG